VGALVRLANTSDNVMINKYAAGTVEMSSPSFKRLMLQLPVSAGVVLFDQIDVSAIYLLPSDTANRYIMYGIKASNFKFGVSYRF